MNETIEKELNEGYSNETLSFIIDEMLFGTKYYKDGVNYYGKSNFMPKAYFDEILSLVHPRLLEQNIHFIFIPNRFNFLKTLLSSDECTRKDIRSLIEQKPYAHFKSDTDDFIYIYEYHLDKKWEEAMIVATIIGYLYELTHQKMPKDKRDKKRERYIHRMLLKIQAHFEEKKQSQML